MHGSRLMLLSGAAFTASFGLLAGGIAFATTRDNYDLWRSGWLLGVYVLWFCAALLFLTTFEVVRSIPPLRRVIPVASLLDASFEYVRNYLIVWVSNDGATLRDAGVTILIPGGLHGPYWHRNNDHPTRGISETETDESVTVDSSPSQMWHGKGFHILGGGNKTQLYWLVTGDPATYPVRLKIYDDEVRPRALTIDGEFTIPPRGIDASQRAHSLKTLQDDLTWNKTQMIMALARGYYDLKADESLRVSDEERVRAHLQHVDPKDEALFELVVTAYAESRRVSDLILEEQQAVRSADHLERAASHIIAALSALAIDD